MSKTNILKYIFITTLLSVNVVAYSDIGSDLEGFFQSMGSTTNITSAGAFQDQSAGYYSGGGMSIRNRVRSTQLSTLQLPRIEAGCGGIDVFLGGFSHIKANELINVLKSIGTSTASYAFKLAMKTVSPMIDGIITELNDLATKVNHANINSCEISTALLGGVWPRDDRTRQHICTSIGVNQGILSDWAAAKQGCGAGGQMNNILSKKDHIDEYKNIFVGDFNIAWQVIKNNEFLLKDKLLAELCMSISGTIVSSKLGEKRNITFYPSKINTELVKVLMNGGSAKIYGCSEYSKCVSIRTKHVDIESAKALINKVRYTITAIMEKAIADIELSVEEKSFVENTKIPIYKVVNILSAYKQNMIDLRDFVDIISVDYLYKYIVDILNIMLDGALNLSMVQVSESDINKFIENLYKVKEEVNNMRVNVYNQFNQMVLLIESVQVYERKLELMFERAQ